MFGHGRFLCLHFTIFNKKLQKTFILNYLWYRMTINEEIGSNKFSHNLGYRYYSHR